MKRFLLPAITACVAIGAYAIDPQLYPNTFVLGVSPDASMLVSSDMGTMKIIDVASGRTATFEGETVDGYNIGLGRPISNDNAVVGTIGTMAAIYQNGKWRRLSTPYPQNPNLANSITPDGRRICGSIGIHGFEMEDFDTPMQIPVVWERQDDGTYSEPILLPYPETDFTGRVPQYVIAVAISDDGNTIVGNVRDYKGFLHTLIYYTYENGEWVMHNEFMALQANPTGVEVPPYPGDVPPTAPDPLDFMTDEERENYRLAVEHWELTTPGDFSLYPQEQDYCTPEEWNAYVLAWNEWNEINESWFDILAAYDQALKECQSQSIIFNNILLSGDGKTCVSTAVIEHPATEEDPNPQAEYTPIKFDLANGTFEIFPVHGMNASYLAEDGTILAFGGGSSAPRQAYVYLPDDTSNPISMMQYFEQKNPAVADWMKQNMLHAVQVYQDGEVIMVTDFECTGTPCASPDLSVIVCAALNDWDESSDSESYLLPTKPGASVSTITIDKGRVNVYDTLGRTIRTDVDEAEATVGLPAGMYIIGNRKVNVRP